MVAGEGQISVEIVGVDKFSQPMGQAGQSAQKMGQSASTAQAGVQKLDSSLGNSSKSATTAAGGYDKVATSTQKLGQQTATTEKSHRNYGVALAGIGTSMVGLAVQVTNLGNTYDNLNDAQLRINSGATKIKSLQKAVEAQTLSLAQAKEKEGVTTEELDIKEKGLAVTKEKLKNAMDRQQNLIEDTGRAWQQFGLQIAGTVMQSVGSLTTAMAALGPAGTGAAKGFSAAGGGAKGFLKSFAPIGIAIAAAAAVFLAIKNNTLGFRDALNELGLKLGTAVPILKPLLEFLKQLGGFLGIAGDESATLKDKFLKNIIALKDQVLGAFNFIINGAKAFVGDLLKAFDEFGKGNWAGGFKKIQDAFMNIINNETLQNFVKNIVAWVTNPSNWIAVGQGILQVFQGLISWTVNDVAPMVTSFVTSIVDFVTDVNNWQKLWDGLVQAWTDMQDWATAIVDWIAPFFDELLKWFEDPKNWEKLWDALVKAWTDIETWWKDVAVPWMEGIAKELETWAGNQENWKKLGEDIANAIVKAVNFTGEILSPIFVSFFKGLESLVPNEAEAKKSGENIANAVISAIGGAVEALSPDFAKINDDIIKMIFGGGGGGEGGGAKSNRMVIANEAPLDNWALRIVQSAMSFLDKYFKEQDTMLGSMATNLWNGWVAASNKKALEVGSGVVTGVQSIVNYLVQGFQGRYQQIQAEGGQLIAQLNTGLLNAAKNISTGVQGVINWISTEIKKAYASFLQWGGDIVKQITTGITNAATEIFNALMKPFNDFKAAVDKMLEEWDVLGKLKEVLGTTGESQYGTQTGTGKKGGGLPEGVVPLNKAGTGFNMPKEQHAELAGNMQGLFAEDAGIFTELINQLRLFQQVYTEVLTAIQELWTTHTQAITNTLVGIGTLISTFVTQIIQTVFHDVQILLLTQVQEMWTMFVVSMTETFIGLGTLITTYITTIIQTLFHDVQTVLILEVQQIWTDYILAMTESIVNLGILVATYVQDIIQGLFHDVQTVLVIEVQELWTTFVESMTETIVSLGILIATYIEDIIVALFQEVQTEVLLEIGELWATMVEETTGELVALGKVIEAFVKVMDAMEKAAIKHTTNVSGSFLAMKQSITKSLQDTMKAIDDFVAKLEDMVDGLKDVEKAADKATSALEKMKEAAEDAAEAASKVGSGLRYGGSYLSRYQRGGSFISTKEQTFKGRRISELDKWELVTVIPLSNPENANDKMSKLFNAPISPTSQYNIPAMGMTGGGGNVGIKRGGNTIVTGNIYATLILPDGRVIAQIANPYLMEGQDAEL